MMSAKNVTTGTLMTKTTTKEEVMLSTEAVPRMMMIWVAPLKETRIVTETGINIWTGMIKIQRLNVVQKAENPMKIEDPKDMRPKTTMMMQKR